MIQELQILMGLIFLGQNIGTGEPSWGVYSDPRGYNLSVGDFQYFHKLQDSFGMYRYGHGRVNLNLGEFSGIHLKSNSGTFLPKFSSDILIGIDLFQLEAKFLFNQKNILSYSPLISLGYKKSLGNNSHWINLIKLGPQLSSEGISKVWGFSSYYNFNAGFLGYDILNNFKEFQQYITLNYKINNRSFLGFNYEIKSQGLILMWKNQLF